MTDLYPMLFLWIVASVMTSFVVVIHRVDPYTGQIKWTDLTKIGKILAVFLLLPALIGVFTIDLAHKIVFKQEADE